MQRTRCSNCAVIHDAAEMEKGRCRNRAQCQFDRQTGLAVTEAIAEHLKFETIVYQAMVNFDERWIGQAPS